MSGRILVAAIVILGAGASLLSWLAARGGPPAPYPAREEAPVSEFGARDMGARGPAAVSEQERAEGFEPILRAQDGRFHKHGWNHYGPGYFTLEPATGVLETHGGMGLLWYSAEMFDDFTLRLEFMTSAPEANSGVFLRVPEMVTSDDYIYHSFEIQIHATAEEDIHRTGAVYDAEAPREERARGPGQWNDMEISFVGNRITVVLNGAQVVDWTAEPRGKIRDFAARGYVGLQNHDWETSVYFRNIRVKKVTPEAQTSI